MMIQFALYISLIRFTVVIKFVFTGALRALHVTTQHIVAVLRI